MKSKFAVGLLVLAAVVLVSGAVGLLVLAAVVLVSGASFLAFASPGSQDDPFITLSYLTNIFRPQVLNDARATEQEMIQRFETRIAELEAQIRAAAPGQGASGTADRFHLVTLNNGQVLSASVGTEIMLRIQTATASGASEPALVNYTSGSTLSSGSALTPNHMYLVTIEGNGVRATGDTVRLLVRGSYTIS
ncbi:MAG: hypothetical protein FWB97_08425 [Oscillospiraceae bacterium]|nr:hypothetical protein [Oscillospiraceae bacterium]